MNQETQIIEVKEHRLGIIEASGPHDVIVQATSIAKELAKIVKENRLSRNISGREYVYVEGWSTMGAMLGVLPREVESKRLEDGSYEATVELIRINDGAVIGKASAIVGMDETWGKRPEYARKSMATTRATGKAYRLGFSWIMGLAGYAPTPAEEMDFVDAQVTEIVEPVQKSKPKPDRPYDAATLLRGLDLKAASYGDKKANEKQRGLTASMLKACLGGDEQRYQVTSYITGGNAQSMNDVDDAMVLALLDWLKPEKDSDGQYIVGEYVCQEAQALLTESLKASGQDEMPF